MIIERSIPRRLTNLVKSEGAGTEIILSGLNECGKSHISKSTGLHEFFTIVETTKKSGKPNEVIIFPLSILELQNTYPSTLAIDLALEMMIFGGLPDVVVANTAEKKRAILANYFDKILIPSILENNRIKYKQAFKKLIEKLARDIGDTVSLRVYAKDLDINFATLNRYLQILKDSYIIFEMRGYKKALANEVSKFSKFYFVDLGLRNLVLKDFSHKNSRAEQNRVWKNFFVSERLKYLNSIDKKHISLYYWKTWEKDSIDLLEFNSKSGKTTAYIFTALKKPLRITPPTAFKKAYPNAHFGDITSENFLRYVRW